MSPAELSIKIGGKKIKNRFFCRATVKLHIVQDTPTVNTSLHRLMWCPQMPQMNSDADDPADGLGIAVVSDTGVTL